MTAIPSRLVLFSTKNEHQTDILSTHQPQGLQQKIYVIHDKHHGKHRAATGELRDIKKKKNHDPC